MDAARATIRITFMVIVDYNKEWSSQFKLIEQVLSNTLSKIIRIEHVGSTSIPGMKAKPILDIDIEIVDMTSFEITKKNLEGLGYKHVGNQDIENREVFKRNGIILHPVLDSIVHHLYVCPSYSKEFKNHILFRDYLRNHKEYVDQYNIIKDSILNKYGENNRSKYVEIKENEYKIFFEEVIKLSYEEEKRLHPTTVST
jgi:GrpB-like predicted nucleotidyltransferase (UPF0157 family)